MPGDDRPRLLVLGADPLREQAFLSWARAGYSVTLVDDRSAGDYQLLADEYLCWPVRDESFDSDQLTRLGRQFDGVTTLSDGCQLAAATVAERLGRPGPGVVAASIARSKLAQRTTLGEADPVWTVVRHAADIGSFFDRAAAAARPARAVFKPVDASASTGARLVSGEAEALAHWPQIRLFSPTSTGILEEYLEGAEVSVEGLFLDGTRLFSSVTCKLPVTEPELVETGHRVSPQAAEPYEAAGATAIERIAAAFQVRTSAMHAEFKVCGDRWTLVEAAVRPAGGMIPRLVQASRGMDLYAGQAALALGGRPPACTPPATPIWAGVRYLVGTGTVKRTLVAGQVLDGQGSVRLAAQHIDSGRHIDRLRGNWSRIASVLGWSEDPTILDRDLAEAESRIRRYLLAE